jgi:hypothetical protein
MSDDILIYKLVGTFYHLAIRAYSFESLLAPHSPAYVLCWSDAKYSLSDLQYINAIFFTNPPKDISRLCPKCFTFENRMKLAINKVKTKDRMVANEKK